ncbi:hypothetical protein N7520_006593 [Penicillium odoratum]|uniref:uncharacterized protein n=1 Tax=Penicillium odoratum TaxID=1167516 RepID=UPI0025465F06|nr:uncharacterized protein N7520_006593 [Penicillium odoratum]KAJ5759437.1 hypothetical protein N7520_006593 [Penicillium odoratum]
MSGLPLATRWLTRPSLSITRIFSPTGLGSIANLHQGGPSRSAVVHEQALPQSQTQEAPFLHTKPTKKPQSQCQSNPNEPTSLDTIISQMPLVQSLRQSHQNYKESRPHLAIPPAIRQHHFVGGSLAGQGKIALAPYMWTSSQTQKNGSSKSKASSVVSVFHIGRDLCGHPGFVHGGLLSVLFDEVFARCVSAAFPSGLGMTANLNVDFRKPALPDRMYVLRAETTKVEGRKAWVEGRMFCLPLALPMAHGGPGFTSDTSLLREDSEGAVMVAEAKALFVEPKFADSMVSVYRT